MNPLAEKDPGDQRSPDHIGFLHRNGDDHPPEAHRQVVQEKPKRGNDARPHKSQNRARPDVLRRTRSQLVERACARQTRMMPSARLGSPRKTGPTEWVGGLDPEAVEIYWPSE